MNYKLLELIRDYPVEIGHWLGLDKLTDLHNEWIRTFLFSKDDFTLQAHRGSYKTTCLAIFFALHILIKPDESLIYVRKTDSDVQQIARQVVKFLRSDCFKRMSVELWGCPISITKDSSSEIDTNLSRVVSGASQISGLGLGSSITGKHADIVVTDDIINIQDRISRAERQKTKYAFMELQNIKNRGGRFINTGTPWHKDDAFELMTNINKYDCYSTGLISQEELQHLRRSMSDSLFAANYELKHIADEEALFSSPQILQKDERDSEGRTPDQMLYEGICHIDAAYGGADATAVTFINKDKQSGRFVVLGKMFDGHVDKFVDRILDYKEFYRIGSTHCETNADKGYLTKELAARGDYVESYNEHMNKFIKIATYLKRDWSNIWFHPDTDPEYISQILDYTEHAEHDDCPDSLASALRIFSEQIGIAHFKEGLY